MSDGNKCVSFSIPLESDTILEEDGKDIDLNKDRSDLVGTAIKK